MTGKAEWQYGRAPSNSWGVSFQHIFYLSAKWRRSFPRPACRTRLREGFQLQSLSYSRSMLALIPILLPFEVTPTAGGSLQSTSWQKGDQVLARDLPWPSPNIHPQGRCKGPPPQAVAHFDRAYILHQRGSGAGGDDIRMLTFSLFTILGLSLWPSSSLKHPGKFRPPGKCGLGWRGRSMWRRRRENSLHLPPTSRDVKGTRNLTSQPSSSN